MYNFTKYCLGQCHLQSMLERTLGALKPFFALSRIASLRSTGAVWSRYFSTWVNILDIQIHLFGIHGVYLGYSTFQNRLQWICDFKIPDFVAELHLFLGTVNETYRTSSEAKKKKKQFWPGGWRFEGIKMPIGAKGFVPAFSRLN